jgi:hypothetical protein
MRAQILIASIAAFAVGGITAAAASACNIPSDKAAAEIQATSDQSAIAALAKMPSFHIYDAAGNEICRIRTTADLNGVSEHYAVALLSQPGMRNAQSNLSYGGDGGYIQLNTVMPVVYLGGDRYEIDAALPANQKVLDEIWPTTVRSHFRASLKKYDFAGVRVGDTLQTVFDTLKKQGYKGALGGQQLYDGYHYDLSCSDEWVLLQHQPMNSTHYNLKMCTAGVTAFEKLDKDGTLYHVEINLTPVELNDRKYALTHALVYEIEAFVKLKQEMEQDYYEKLADQRYGAERHGALDSYDPPFRFFTDPTDTFQDRTRFDVTPEERDLKVSVEDRDLLNEKYDATAEALLKAAKTNAATVPTPRF